MKLSAKYASRYLNIVTLLLYVIALSKIFSFFWPAPILNISDPIFLLKRKYLAMFVGLLEMAIAIYFVLEKRSLVKLMIVTWLSCSFLAYRIALHVLKADVHCKCLGNMFDWIPVFVKHEELFILGIIAFLLVGSLMFIFLQARSDPRVEVTQKQ